MGELFGIEQVPGKSKGDVDEKTDTLKRKGINMAYILSYAKNGGIGIYNIKGNGELIYMDMIPLNKAMYMTISDMSLYVLLREPFESSKESVLVSYKIESNGKLTTPSDIASTKGHVACHLG